MGALVLAGALALGAGGSSATAGTSGVELRKLGDFAEPVYADNAPGERKLVFVVERAGTIRVMRKGRRLGKPFLDIRGRVLLNNPEAGLLSLAFHPDYEKNRTFFVYYVNKDGDLEVDRFKRRKRKATVAKRHSRRTVIEIAHPTHRNHNGGQLQFGPDGFLYLGTGDGGNPDDPDENAQDHTSLLGKLLRIDPRAKGGYRIPHSNPLWGSEGSQDEIFSLGLRNPWRFSFDRRTDEITIGDVGQAAWEEIDHLSLAAARGANFGWDNLEGNQPHEAPFTPPPGYVAPIHQYPHAGGACSITGGYVVRDKTLPIESRYVYADYCLGEIRSLDPDAGDPPATDLQTGLTVPALSSFGEGTKGRIYVASLLGPVYRIVAG